MNRDRDVAEHGFRSRRRNDYMARTVNERVPHEPKLTVLLAGFDFQIRDGRLKYWIPVHEALTAVNEALFVQAHEHFGHDV